MSTKNIKKKVKFSNNLDDKTIKDSNTKINDTKINDTKINDIKIDDTKMIDSKDSNTNVLDMNTFTNIEINNNLVDTNSEYGLITSNLHIPYKKTILSTPIMISPDQMDNKMYIHLKSNLKNKLEGKCYENYGYIDKIYNIEEISDGIIEPEDPSCSAKMDVKFTCNLFLPIVNKEIICKIDRMNKALIMGINGPIKVIITIDKINKENFFPDINRNIRIKKTSEIIVPDMYLRIIVLSKSFSNYDKNILVIGYLQDIATQKEIDKYMEKIDNNEIEQINLLDN
jgi:DNA-directed RNA polymerase subunit E'/Rpb7